MGLKFYSRHEATNEQIKLLNKVDQDLSLGLRISFEDELLKENIYGEVVIEQISEPFDSETGPSIDGEKVIAGVFPAQALCTMLCTAQEEGQDLSIITFKFERDRTGKDGNAQVLALKSAVVYSILKGKLQFPREIEVQK